MKRPTTIRRLSVFVLVALLCLTGSSNASPSPEVSQDVLRLRETILEKGARWEAGETSVSNLSPEAKKRLAGTLRGGPPPDMSIASPALRIPLAGLPLTLNWRSNKGNFVTPVRDQLSCGSCWAFGPVAALESKILIKTQKPGTDLDLSEQVMVSCLQSGNCTGGHPGVTASYLTEMGAPVESCYPYAGYEGICSGSCPGWYNRSYKATQWYYWAKPTVVELKAALNAYGPISTTMEVFEDFYNYTGGIYSHVSGSYAGGHCVLLVGYNDAEGYFIAKNSWGGGWGIEGFFRIDYSEVDGAAQFGLESMGLEDARVPQLNSTITVIGPNGGEAWKRGTTQEIRWRTRGNVGSSVRIGLYRDGTYERTISSSTPVGEDGWGSFRWQIPSTLKTGSKFRIRIASVEDGSITDQSDSNFSITSVAPAGSLNLIYPNGGESVWMLDVNPVNISWNYKGVPGPTVKLDLLKAGKVYTTIADSLPIGSEGKGRFGWYLPEGFPVASDYRVQVTSNWNENIKDRSDAPFSVAGRPCRLFMTVPNGGEVWERGSTYNLTWYQSCDLQSIELGPTVRIDLYKGGSWYMNIVPETWINYAYSWKIPPCLPDGSDYKIRIVSSRYRLVYDLSDKPFKISGGAPLSALILKSPSGGESWQEDTNRAITWRTVGVPVENVKIDLYLGDSFLYKTLAPSTPNGGFYVWPLSSEGMSNDFRICISSVEDPTIRSMSRENFSIRSTSPMSQINLAAPVGGESWRAGTNRQIVWTYGGSVGKRVKLELFRAGTKVANIARSIVVGTEGRGSCSWWIPRSVKAGSEYRVKVSSLSDPNLYDFNDMDFTITAPEPLPTITLSSPNGGEVLEKGTLTYIHWTYTGELGANVGLDLFKSGTKALTIASSTTIGADGSGFYPWKIPYSLGKGDDYSVGIHSLSNPSVNDRSARKFTVTNVPTYYRYVLKWGGEGTAQGRFKNPSAIAVDKAGNVYVADSETHRIQKFSPKGVFLTSWGKRGGANGQFDGPSGLAVDDKGRVHVADSGNGRIQRFSSSGAFLDKWNSWGGGEDEKFDVPSSVAVDSSGSVYVADMGARRICRFDSALGFLKLWGTPGSGEGQFALPSGLAAHSLKGVFVVDAGADRVQRFGANGMFIGEWGKEGSAFGEFRSPLAVAVDASGRVYVADGNNHRMQKFSSTGAILAKWGSQGELDGQFNHPCGVAVGPGGEVYVLDCGNFRVQKFAPP